MMKYVTRIKAKVNIHANKKTSALFDGSYKSVYSGNGFDFEDLREYIPGDNIRDIDWKASSRSRNILVKRYVAERKHNVLLVFDAGKTMSADSATGQNKKETALNVGGTLGYLVARNGDQIGAIWCCDGAVKVFPLRAGLSHLEHILTMYDRQGLADANQNCDTNQEQNNLEKSLNYIVKNISRRMIVMVITDMAGIHGISEDVLKRLTCMNDVIFVSVSDARLTDGKSYSIDKASYIPEFISGDKKLRKIEQETRARIRGENDSKLARYRIVSTEVDSDEDVADKITELLERHKYAGNR